jgi:tripartite-type tricarboxylate transporter receptor subunit TctC
LAATKDQLGGKTMRLTRSILCGLAAALLLAGASTASHAESWPQRSVKFIVPFGPGAGADIGARLIQEKLAQRWGKPVVIENRPGADSIVAIQALLSANDDHTFMFGPSGNFIVHPYQYQKLPYDPNELVPIARYSATILSLGVPAALNIDTLPEFVKHAQANPGKLNSAAVPGITELAFDYFAKKANLTFAKVPYRDIVQAVNDLAENRLQAYSSSYAIQRPHRQGGRIKVIAQMGAKRAPSLPDVPNGVEQGFPALEMEGLVGLFGTKAVSPELREKIGADIVAVANDKEIEDKLNATAQSPARGNAKEFTDHIDRQKAQIANIVKELDFKPTR